MNTPKLEELLLELERGFWRQGADYARRHLADGAVMVMPDPDGVLVGDAIARSLEGAPRWSEVDLGELQLIDLGTGAAVITYEATARRKGGPVYVARASSAYVRSEGAWKLAFHQQTPVRNA